MTPESRTDGEQDEAKCVIETARNGADALRLSNNSSKFESTKRQEMYLITWAFWPGRGAVPSHPVQALSVETQGKGLSLSLLHLNGPTSSFIGIRVVISGPSQTGKGTGR